ncbi:MAG: MFS transporter [Chthonomonadaceae bacterium]|nr:MFS transporter [Chthonomonadaceae bacterium]
MRLPALRHHYFRSYLTGAFVSNLGTRIQGAALAWHIFQLTGSPLMVGLLGLVRVGPLVLFTLFGGVLADQADRRKVLLATQTGMAITALALFLLSLRAEESVWPMYVVVAIYSVARAFDGPARQSLVVNLVPRTDFPNAASLNGITWRLTDVLGPMLAGVLIASGGLAGLGGISLCYALNAISFGAVLLVIYRFPSMRAQNAADRARSIWEVLDRIKDGLTFVNRTPAVRSAMWIDFWATFLSGAEALIPSFAADVLGLGAVAFGVLSAATGVGAMLAAAGLALMPTVRRQGRLVVIMIGVFGLATIAFGLSPNLWVAALSLAVGGAADMISTVMRQTIRQLATPDELRGRMTATSSLFHISGPQLGDFEAGAVATLSGVRFSIVLGGALCVGVAGLWSRATALVEYTHESEHEVGERPSETSAPTPAAVE